ncbi:MAG: peptide deformylase [Bacteroidales bacterium]|nr:peptide deformylase [Bacteroidales bacterium]MDZ4204104.1 peptide deformylase [Bacteroidales bacterium]
MILPVVAYGHPLLKKVAADIDKNYPDLQEFVTNMFETMYASLGVGLAAPQVSRSIRIFIVDCSPYADEHPELAAFKKVFINPHITEESGEEWTYSEGCLSLPDLREDVTRKSFIRIQYHDENFNFFDETYDGLTARIIQHEYDHLDGVLFVDRISPLRKTLLKRKLSDISKGNIDVDYKMIFPLLKKRIA